MQLYISKGVYWGGYKRRGVTVPFYYSAKGLTDIRQHSYETTRRRCLDNSSRLWCLVLQSSHDLRLSSHGPWESGPLPHFTFNHDFRGVSKVVPELQLRDTSINMFVKNPAGSFVAQNYHRFLINEVCTCAQAFSTLFVNNHRVTINV